MKIDEHGCKVANAFGGGTFRWIARSKNICLNKQYLGAYNTLFMTRIYYKKELAYIVRFFSKSKSFRDLQKLLERRSADERRKALNFVYTAIGRRFLVPESFSESEKTREVVFSVCQDGVRIGLAYMIFSLNCNLRCPHCFIIKERPRSGYPVMTKKEVESCIDYYLFNLRDFRRNPRINFYGGEPLLYSDLLIHCVTYAEKRAAEEALHGQFQYLIQTNGTLINDRILNFARDFKIGFAISLDGFAPQHDKQRIDWHGRGTFKRVVGNIDKALRRHVDVGLSITATPRNVARLPYFISWIRNRYGDINLGISWLIDNRTRDTKVGVSYYRKLEQLFIYCAEHNVPVERLWRRVDHFQGKRPYPCYCGGVGGQIGFVPGGLIGPCHAFSDTCYFGERKYFVKIPNGQLLRDHPLWRSWYKTSAYWVDNCRERCDMFTLCGGGCAFQALVHSGNLLGPDEEFC